MEGADVEVNVRMKEILRKPLYSKEKGSRLSFRCDRGLCGVCLPIISLQNLKNSKISSLHTYYPVTGN